MWNGVVEHIAVQFQCVPLRLTNAVATLAAMNSGKVKRPGDENFGMSDIDV